MKKYIALVFVIVLVSLLFTTNLTGNDKDLLILSESNTVSLNTPITEDSVKSLQVELMEKGQKLSSKQPIILTLNSPGGSIDAGFKLIETAKGLGQRVDTLSLFSASMSFITSQYLGVRYTMSNSTLMSHRAYLGGIEGQIPGSFVTRTNHILSGLLDIDKFIANKAGITVAQYESAIANELWMYGEKAVEAKYADRLVRVRCDKSLQGPGKTQHVQILTFEISVTYHKCPLITEPLSIQLGSNSMSAEADHIWQLYLNDKPRFIEEYIVNGKFNQYVK